jgi:hypothetical protein
MMSRQQVPKQLDDFALNERERSDFPCSRTWELICAKISNYTIFPNFLIEVHAVTRPVTLLIFVRSPNVPTIEMAL